MQTAREVVIDMSAADASKLTVTKVQRLGWFLVFAVVYADIGTSVFYTAGILYGSIGYLATLAQIITTGVFISIAFKYVEICERCQDGGGVVSICRTAFSRWTFLPLVGGALITVDYFLTSAISGVSGLYYLASLFNGTKPFVVPATVTVLFCLAVLNIVGLRESATVTSWFALGQIAVIVALIGGSAVYLTRNSDWLTLCRGIIDPRLPNGHPLTVELLAIGYATTWLAYSGLESAAQVSGGMVHPIRKTAGRAMWLVIGCIAIFMPIITATSLHIVPDSIKQADPESLIAQLGLCVGGYPLQLLAVLAATSLLLMACNTAMVGNYHVNVRLADLGFLPGFLRKRHPRFGTPHISIIISAAIPILILIVTRGNVARLGDLYAFGLLGTLTLSSIAVDRLRWRDGQRGFRFWMGILTTVAVAAAFAINIFHKPHALLFGGSITLLIVGWGYFFRQKIEREAEKVFDRVETQVADLPEAQSILSLDEAIDAREIESAEVMIAVSFTNPRLLKEAALHIKGSEKQNAYVVFVEEMPGLYTPPEVRPSPRALKTLADSCKLLREHGVSGIPIWRIAEDAGRALAEAATLLGVDTAYVGSSKRTFFWRMIRGRLLKRLADGLPEKCNLIIVG